MYHIFPEDSAMNWKCTELSFCYILQTVYTYIYIYDKGRAVSLFTLNYVSGIKKNPKSLYGWLVEYRSISLGYISCPQPADGNLLLDKSYNARQTIMMWLTALFVQRWQPINCAQTFVSDTRTLIKSADCFSFSWFDKCRATLNESIGNLKLIFLGKTK